MNSAASHAEALPPVRAARRRSARPPLIAWWGMALIAAAIAVLAAMLWFVPRRDILSHNILHHLNFIPVIAAGLIFGWKGAAAATAFALLAQSPHLVQTYRLDAIFAIDQVVELSIFGVAGIVTGLLTTRERRQRRHLETTKRELEVVHEELQQNVEKLRKAERLSAAGQLAAGLAHEIRNPLASIAGAAGILRRGNASSENREACLEIIDKESQRLNKLLTHFLEFARPRTPRFQRTDVTAIVESVLALARHSSGAAHIEFRQQIEPAIPEVDCDPEQLKQVLLNLVINAMQATDGAGEVWVRARCQRDRLVVSVSDQGCGIPEDQRGRLFDPFFTTKETGTGLGLAVASKIIEQHGGQLTAADNPDRGMTFRIELPLSRKETR